MLIKIKTHPGFKKDKVIRKTEDSLEVWLKEKPIMNQANKALIDLLSDFFKIDKVRIKLIKGFKNKNKIIEIKR
ncbi:MAG: DUF167 domain-containing protein [Patescibacteria group bacterium]|nr:DUF167 domain-containing protein [Patescibacteria group bacterium]MBU1877250.1 DUF167 domain-containing protein [Patescibacteria group bacterium]